MKKAVIIGAGVIGCAVARALSHYDLQLEVLEQGHDVCEGASKANSAIVHAGFDALPGTLKAALNVRGAQLFPEFCRELGVPYQRIGAMVTALSTEDLPVLQRLYAQGKQNGAEVQLLTGDEARALEPSLSVNTVGALLAPGSAITSPYLLTYALADHAAVNGAVFRRNVKVSHVQAEGTRWKIETNVGTIEADIVINCAGTGAALIHNQIGGPKVQIVCRRGEYWLLDRQLQPPFSRTIFQCPTKMGKGVLLSPTVHGNFLIGPTAEDIPETDTETTAEGLAKALESARQVFPSLSTKTAITQFSGVRAHPEGDDFIIGSNATHAYEAIGIESPGLSAAPAIAEMLCRQITEQEQLLPHPILPPIPMHPDLEALQKAQPASLPPEDTQIVCRCEAVTEGEIRSAIRRPVGATSLDGVKRRCRAGMGRCQGGFCSPRVTEILSEELKIPMNKVCKAGPGSELLAGTIDGEYSCKNS